MLPLRKHPFRTRTPRADIVCLRENAKPVGTAPSVTLTSSQNAALVGLPPIASVRKGDRENVMNDLLEAVRDSNDALPLDPFGSQPQWTSRIAGLGGHEPPPDPSYVFLTLDTRPAIGMVCATVRFFDLVATRGTLLFEVRVRSAVPGGEPSRLQTVVVDADELVQSHGVVELTFESYRNAYYAIACSINDEMDVAASHISISIDRRATPAQHGRNWEWSAPADRLVSRRSGIEDALIARSLTDLNTPRLALPMSQVGAPSQCREPAFANAMTILRRESVATPENWSLAYVLQAIGRFGGIQNQYRMLGYGVDEGPLLSYFASQGHEVVGFRHTKQVEEPLDPGQQLQQLWVPELCKEADFFAHAHFTTGDIRHPVTALANQFDVIWSIGANRSMTPQEFGHFALNGMVHARPGGLAVHVFDYVDDAGADQGTSLARHDIERIAVLALSHRIDVARLQFRYGATSSERGTSLPFGLVMLRGGLPEA